MRRAVGRKHLVAGLGQHAHQTAGRQLRIVAVRPEENDPELLRRLAFGLARVLENEVDDRRGILEEWGWWPTPGLTITVIGPPSCL